MKRIVLPLALFAALTVHAQYTGVTADLRLVQDQLMPDEDMQLKLRVINRSGQPLTLGQDNHWVTFSITSDDGSVAPLLMEVPIKGEFTLQSGQSGTKTLNLTPCFDFRRPGHYHVAAVVHLSQWNQDVGCRPVGFFIGDGVVLPGVANIPVGVAPPPGVTNVPPLVHFYSLIKVEFPNQVVLYFRLTDRLGQTLRVFPLARLLSFSTPEAQLDHSNNLHVIFQTGARDFSYFVIDTGGRLLAREVHDYAGSRPSLRVTDDGQVYVHGGIRRYTSMDIPSPAPTARQ